MAMPQARPFAAFARSVFGAESDARQDPDIQVDTMSEMSEIRDPAEEAEHEGALGIHMRLSQRIPLRNERELRRSLRGMSQGPRIRIASWYAIALHFSLKYTY